MHGVDPETQLLTRSLLRMLLTDESVGLCLSMGNAKLADFAETTMALVNYYDADRTRTVFLLSYEHASI